MNTSSITTALEMLAEEFERTLAEVNQKGSDAFLRKDYVSVTELAEQARQLENYQRKVADLEEEWSADRVCNPLPAEKGTKWTKENTVTPAAFHNQCIEAVEKRLRLKLTKKTRSSYLSDNGDTALVCAVSREHTHQSSPYFWFAFHPYQSDFLAKSPKAFVVFGCGSPKNILLIPYTDFASWSKRFNRTERSDSWYSHVRITIDAGKFALHLSGRAERVDLTKYLVK